MVLYLSVEDTRVLCVWERSSLHVGTQCIPPCNFLLVCSLPHCVLLLPLMGITSLVVKPSSSVCIFVLPVVATKPAEFKPVSVVIFWHLHIIIHCWKFSICTCSIIVNLFTFLLYLLFCFLLYWYICDCLILP